MLRQGSCFGFSKWFRKIFVKMNINAFFSTTFCLCVGLVIAFSCNKPHLSKSLNTHSIIPLPIEIEATNKVFEINAGTAIYLKKGNRDLLFLANYLAEMIRPATGFPLSIIELERPPDQGGIYLACNELDKHSSKFDEYELMITEKMISISGAPSGIFYGIQTLRHLLPENIELNEPHSGSWLIPTGRIYDAAEYEYRGAMLDVSRHFFDVVTVKRILDYLAMYKMNVLHLHLSDDQGWRIEIESWPNLTKYGGSTGVGGGEGGYYTKNDYKEIVRYATERFITIVPEIDMPGHTHAALASYPELSCDGKPLKLYTGVEVGFSTLCTRKEVVYEFVNDVVGEISEITPGSYFHVGGDESWSTDDDDYIYFMNRVNDIVSSHGKKIIGWDEIAHSNIGHSDIVQYWSKEENALKAVGKGAKVIMSPSKFAYLDMKYDSTTRLGLNWSGYIEVDVAYNWNPITLIEGVNRTSILGIESPLWSETIDKLSDIEYLMFPRIAGYAEIGWTHFENRDWDEYKVRLGKQHKRYEAMNINYYKSKLVPWSIDESSLSKMP